MHADKHSIKMILEYAQLLSTAHRVLDGIQQEGKTKTGRKSKYWILPDDREDMLYSATHIHHPSAIWVRQNKSNYVWLSNLLVELCEEYTYRYGRTHKVEETDLCYVLLKNIPKNIKEGQFTGPTPAMPDECKVPGDSITSYRKYYVQHKRHLASWQGKVNSRPVPVWYT